MNFRLLIIGVLLVGLGCGKGSEEADAGSSGGETIPVEVVAVKKISAPRFIELSGNIEPWKQVDLGGEMTAKIEKLFVEEGDEVKQGQLLARMSDENLVKTRAQLEVVKKDWERIKRLLEKKTATQQAFDRVQAEYDAARASYESVLSSTRIRATIDGTVTRKYLEEGEVYLMMPGEASSPAILELMELDRLKIIVGITESDLSRIAAGDSAEIRLDAYPDTVFAGNIHRIEPTLDQKTRTVKVEIVVQNKGRLLKPGMFARVNLATGAANGLFVPKETVLQQPGTGVHYLFEVEGGKAVRQDVKTGIMYGEMIEVTAGLEADASVVISGQTKLSSGAAVKVVRGGQER